MVEMKERQPFSTISSRSSGNAGPRDVRAGAAARLADAPGFPIGHPEESDAFESSVRQTCSSPWP